jgi:hypothetical protein
LIGIGLHDLFVFIQWQRRHLCRETRVELAVVVGVRDAPEFIETMLQRRKHRRRPEVPFAKDATDIALRLQQFRQQNLVRMNAFPTRVIQRALHRHSIRLTARQKRSA